MTAMAPQPQRSPQSPQARAQAPAWQTRPAPPDEALTGGQPAATAPSGRRAQRATGRSRARRSTPAQLRIARGIAAAVCLLPGVAALGALTSATTSDAANAPALVRADISRHAALARAHAAVAWSTGVAADRARVATDLTQMAAAMGRAEAVRPDWGVALGQAKQTVGRESGTILALLAGGPAAGAQPTTGATANPSSAAAATATDLQQSLDNLASATSGLPALTDETGNDTRWAAVLGATALAVVGLLGASAWLARKTHRVVNPGLALALLGTVAIGTVAGQTLAGMVTSSTAETIAGVRVNAAVATAGEASALLPGVTLATAESERAAAASEGARKVAVLGAGSPTSLTWQSLRFSTLTTKPTATQAEQKLAALATADSSFATQQTSAAGTNSALPAVLGYGLFGVSLLAAAAAWTGVGGRLAEYR